VTVTDTVGDDLAGDQQPSYNTDRLIGVLE